MSSYKVVEKFASINGEGRKAGELSIFIRFAGCNLRCGYCDTKWAYEKNVNYELLSTEEIVQYIINSGINNVTLTGGEPLIQKDIKNLLRSLANIDYLNIEVETNGSLDLSPFIEVAPRISYTMDYKTNGSGMESYMKLDNFLILRKFDTVKFVVTDLVDLNKMFNIVQKYKLIDTCKVYISPVFGMIDYVTIVNFILKNKLNKLVFQIQLHKIIWEPEKRGV